MTPPGNASRNVQDLTDIPDQDLIDTLRNAPGDIELTKTLHVRISRMCDACYEEAMRILCRKHSEYIREDLQPL